MSKINIVNEDCISGMQRHLSDSTVNVIVTSPPYNLGIKYGEYNDHISREKYLEWMVDAASELYRVLSDDGSLFLNLGSKPTDPWVAYDVLNVFRRTFQLQNTFVWAKALSIDGVGSWGHYKPLNSKRFVNDCWEFVFHLSKHGDVPLDRLALGVPYADKTNIKRWGKEDVRCRGNVWFVDTPQHDNDAAWLAGIIDGEGCISIQQRKGKGSHSPVHTVCISITNTSYAMIRRVQDIVGDGYGKVYELPQTARFGKRKLWLWQATANQAIPVLARIYPYLVAKQCEAKVALFMASTKQTKDTPGNTRLSDETIALRSQLWAVLKQLHCTDDKTISDWVPEPQIERIGSSNVWHVPYETIQSRKTDRPHPATFPVQLVTNCLLLHGVAHIDLVLDPFMGLGSTARACRVLDLDCIGFEIDPEYCKETTVLLGGLR